MDNEEWIACDFDTQDVLSRRIVAGRGISLKQFESLDLAILGCEHCDGANFA